jgi:hypothetical protein
MSSVVNKAKNMQKICIRLNESQCGVPMREEFVRARTRISGLSMISANLLKIVPLKRLTTRMFHSN